MKDRYLVVVLVVVVTEYSQGPLNKGFETGSRTPCVQEI